MKPPTILIAKALVLDAAGNCLVLRRSSTHPRQPLQPDLPGGERNDGESPAEAVCREIMEETGLIVTANALHILFAKTTWEHDENRIRFLFVVRLTELKPAVHISWEHDQANWLPFQDILKVLKHPGYVPGIKYGLKHGLI